MLKKYIKVAIADIEQGLVDTRVNDELSTILAQDAGLDIPAGTLFTDCLINETIDGYIYLLTSPRDLKNKCRMYPQSDREKKSIEDYINSLGLETVDVMPDIEVKSGLY